MKIKEALLHWFINLSIRKFTLLTDKSTSGGGIKERNIKKRNILN